MENIDKSEKYKELNETFNDYLLTIEGTFFYNHIAEFLSLAIKARKIITTSDPILQDDPRIYKLLNPSYDELTERLPYPETLEIVREYLKERLPQYIDTFEEWLNNGTINIAIDLEDPMEDIREHAGYKEDGNHHYVNSVIRHNYFDPQGLIHEFIHCLNCPSQTKAPSSRRLLTETVSIFFECDVLRFMQEKGYSSKEIAKVLHTRIEECNNLCSYLLTALLLLNTFKYTGSLSDESYEEAERLHLPRKAIKDNYLKDVDRVYESLQRTTEPPNISAGYMIGIIIAFSSLAKEDPTMVDRFAMLNESLNSKSETECLQIIGINLNDNRSKKEVLENFQKGVEEVCKAMLKEDFHSKRI